MDLLNLRALLTLDKSDYEKGLSDAEGQATGFGGKFKSAMGTAAKAGGAALAASASAVALLGKSSIGAYADTQQLVGGVQKLYGNMGMSVQEYAKSVNKSVSEVNADWKRNEQAQNIVLENAKNAFKTAGLSYNDYMENATSFSASLINSLGGDTVKAAEQTDVAMRAISDNFNTFGGDIGMIQGAFQNFAKQNYMMLDNLKLGYGGTKQEMERLIADANTWAEENGKAADLSIDSFSDVVTAIDYIQQKQQIAGTTANEAASTISGSIGMVKAAWENLMAGLADPDADIGELTKNLVDSVSVAGKNLLPAVQQFGEGFGQALTELAPSIISGVPKLLSTALPTIITSATNLIGVLVTTLQTTLPQLGAVGLQLMQSLIKGIQQNLPTMIQTGMTMLTQFSGKFRSFAGNFISLGLQLIKSIADGIIKNIPTFIQTVPTIISNFAGIINDNAPKIIETGFSILKSLVLGIIKAIPLIIENMPKIIKAIVDVFMAFQWINLGKLVVNGITKGLGALKASVGEQIGKAKEAIVKGFSSARKSAVQSINALKKGVADKITGARTAVSNAVGKIKSSISNGFEAAKDSAVRAFEGIVSGAKSKLESAKKAVEKGIKKIKRLFPFNVGKIFSGLIKLPKISVSKTGDGGAKTSASTSSQRFAKAMNNPYLFNRPTNFMAGDVGDEMLYGKSALMKDIKQAVKEGDSLGGQSVIINLNYDASSDANDMARDIAKNVRRYRMAGAF